MRNLPSVLVTLYVLSILRPHHRDGGKEGRQLIWTGCSTPAEQHCRTKRSTKHVSLRQAQTLTESLCVFEPIPGLIVVSCPAPLRTCEKGGSGILNDFSCHSSPIRELESDCRTSSSTRSSMPAVRCTCIGNVIITFFMPFDPAPCDKKCRSEHQTLFPLFRGGVWGRD